MSRAGGLELESIAARLKAAIPGPWGRIGWDVTGDCTYLFSVLSDPERRGRVDVQQATRNLDFIAHAPDDIAALLEEVRALRTALRHVINAVDPAQPSFAALKAITVEVLGAPERDL